jgi:hypothetical protein
VRLNGFCSAPAAVHLDTDQQTFTDWLLSYRHVTGNGPAVADVALGRLTSVMAPPLVETIV